MMPLSRALLLGALLAPAVQAQVTLEFPLESGSRLPSGERVLSPDHGAIASLAALAGQGPVRLLGLTLPDGEVVDLDLVPIDIARRRFGFRVDGRPRPDLLDGLGLSVWRGHVSGEPHAPVHIAFGHYGSHGWIEREGQTLHLVARPDAGGDYLLGHTLITSDALLAARGVVGQLGCGLGDLPEMHGEGAPPPPTPAIGLGSGGPCSMLECTIAMETDYQLFTVFGNLGAMTSYVTTLLTFVSDRYETQINTVLTFPYLQFYTNSNDPWTTQDGGGGAGALLTEFRNAWVGNVPTGARLAHFMSGANLGGGVAWLDVLCNNQYNFGVSGNINGGTTFPVQQNTTTWDFMVVAHEIGHNFASPHTHDYCPPLDQCAPSGYFGQCQTQQACTSSGTIMSYCHLCSGGMANITTYFHPSCVLTMSLAAANCLPQFGGGITGTFPVFVQPGASTPVTAQILGTPVGGVQLRHRTDGGAWQTVAMTNQGGGQWSADLPPASCGDALEVYVQYTDLDCGVITDPPGAPGATYAPEVGLALELFADDFEQDRGWFNTNLGATAGNWQRGIPVNDPNWAYDPVSDHDGSGRCYLTENQLGNSDVDNGAVRLTSPAMDLSGGVTLVRYAYFLRLTNQNGADRLLVEASSSGLAGPWVEIAVHTTDGGLSWRTHAIPGADLLAAGLLPSADWRFRFTANDANPQSVVEAGLDAFEVLGIDCVDPGPTSYCTPGNANSVSPGGAVLSAVSGSPGGVLTLQLDGVPLQPGIFFYGPNQVDLPFGCGRRCVGGTTTRSGVYFPGGSSFQAVVDTSGGAPNPFRIQFWYRDPAHEPICGGGFNLSNALAY